MTRTRIPIALVTAGLVMAHPAVASAAQTLADFNGDGRDDLAVGVWHETVDGAVEAGAVNVLYGAKQGPTTKGSQFIHRGSRGVAGDPTKSDQFGSTLAVGDFNGDRYDDLAIGAPGEMLLGEDNNNSACFYEDRAGAVYALFGSRKGLRTKHSLRFDQDSRRIDDEPEGGDHFGCALATGDLDGDGLDDLAIGASGEEVAGQPQAGVVHVLSGDRRRGLRSGRRASRFFGQQMAPIAGEPEQNDRFGVALAIGEFGRSEHDDLAIGASLDTAPGNVDAAGAVHVLYGSAKGAQAQGSQLIGKAGSDPPAIGDYFGIALAAGDMVGDGHDDLAIGATMDTPPGGDNGGSVSVLAGSGAGLDATDQQLLTQAGTPGAPVEVGDEFGNPLVTGAFGRGGKADLAVGVIREDLGSLTDAGAVQVFFGAEQALLTTDTLYLDQALPAVQGEPGNYQFFGNALGAGRYGTGKQQDLLIGNQRLMVDGAALAGAVHLVPSSKQGPQPARTQFFNQGIPGLGGGLEAGDQFGYALG